MIVNKRNLRVGGSLGPSNNKALFLKPAILLPIIVIKTIAMFQSVRISVSHNILRTRYLKRSAKKSLLDRQHNCFPGRCKSVLALVTGNVF